MNLPTLADLERMARQAGQILRDGYEKDHQVNYKGVIDLVTEVDHQSEAFLIGEIQRLFPGHQIMAEESGSLDGHDEHLWLIDPLDGTVNYAHGVPFFCTSIGYAHKGQVALGAIYDPMRDELFTAERGKGSWVNGRPLKTAQAGELIKSLLVTGFPYDTWTAKRNNFDYFVKLSKLTQGVRRLGSAAIDLCYVAAGRLDGFWELSLNPWDVAAGGLVAEEAGATVTNVDGGADYVTRPVSVLAANPVLHAKLLAELR
ncbi:MAG: inositol monophosphatase [Chloroflexi bacterium]|nr:MAG: inositol monophosphatase [Chloroflexota bacterium]